MRHVSLIVLTSLSLVACTAGGGDDAVGNDSAETVQRQFRSSLERPLSPTLAVPNDTPVGRSIAAVVDARTSGLTASDGDQGSCVRTEWRDAAGKLKVVRKACAEDGSTILWIGPRSVGADEIYSDHSGDGKIDSYRSAIEPIVDLEDRNYDGRVDVKIVPASSVGGLTLEGFAEGWGISDGGTLANYILEDDDHDGMFEIASITAKAPSFFER